MKRLIIMTALLAGFTFQLAAQTKKEKIIELFKLMKTDKMMASMMGNMMKMFPKSSMGDNPDPQKDSVYQDYVRNEAVTFSKKLMDDDMVDIYDKYFTMEEIKFYISFYKTPEGQKMLDVSPAIQKDLMAKMMSSDMPEFQEKLKKKAEEIYGQ